MEKFTKAELYEISNALIARRTRLADALVRNPRRAESPYNAMLEDARTAHCKVQNELLNRMCELEPSK